MMRLYVNATPILYRAELEGVDPMTGQTATFWNCPHPHPDAASAHECGVAEIARRFPDLPAPSEEVPGSAEVPSS